MCFPLSPVLKTPLTISIDYMARDREESKKYNCVHSRVFIQRKKEKKQNKQ